MHEDPQVPNVGKPNRGDRLVEGMTLAVEPMINMGVAGTEPLADKWTIVTKDRKLSAHFEHTIAVTRKGADILTLPAPTQTPQTATVQTAQFAPEERSVPLTAANEKILTPA